MQSWTPYANRRARAHTCARTKQIDQTVARTTTIPRSACVRACVFVCRCGVGCAKNVGWDVRVPSVSMYARDSAMHDANTRTHACCVPARMRVRAHANERVRAACTRACMRACMHACMRAFVRACMHACMHACMPACMHACIQGTYDRTRVIVDNWSAVKNTFEITGLK